MRAVAAGYLVALADGAGGSGDGAAAAEALIEFVMALAEKERAASIDWFAALCQLDEELAARGSGGQATGIVALIDDAHVRGASVGDSCAYLIASSGSARELTGRQRRKPLLGSGEALPVVFNADCRGDRFLAGSDGLFKYAPLERICALAAGLPAAEAAHALAECARLPSGARHDDVAVVVVTP